MGTFEQGYKKFINFIKQNNLIPDDRNKIIIAYSGGKDASLMCDFLNEYKKNERPDLNIELVNAGFPGFLYDTDNISRKKIIDEALGFWSNKGISFTKINANIEYPDSILEVETPCKICAFTKTKLLGNYIRQEKNEDAIFCLGLNFDDSLGWFIEILLLAAGKGNWEEIKEKNPDLYNEMLILSVRIVCSIYSKKNNILFIRPMMNLNNDEIHQIVIERKLPLIPEDCKEITQRNNFYDSPRRDIAKALSATRSKYPFDSMNGRDAIYTDYFKALEYFNNCGLIPEQKELDGFMSDSLMV